MRNINDSQISNKEIDDIFFGDVLSTFLVSFLVSFFSIFGGLVLSVFLIRMLIENNIL